MSKIKLYSLIILCLIALSAIMMSTIVYVSSGLKDLRNHRTLLLNKLGCYNGFLEYAGDNSYMLFCEGKQPKLILSSQSAFYEEYDYLLKCAAVEEPTRFVILRNIDSVFCLSMNYDRVIFKEKIDYGK